MIPLDKEGSLTNDERPGFFRSLCRMLIALRYRSEPRRFKFDLPKLSQY